MIKTKRQASRIKNLFGKDNMMKTVAVRTINRANSLTTKALGHAGYHWARTTWQTIDVQRESADKVHLDVRINRFDINDQLIADFDSLWVITFKNGKWAAQFRSSFATS